tara:strand:+ start:8768 stop:9793 length:1026 start_codon:yes stop_codon:yes gene_type:complete
MIKELKKKILILKKSKKKKVFYFGNTVKKETNRFYITPINENKRFIYFGAIIFSNYHAKKISKLIDGKVDFVLVDVEKKVFSKKKSELVNIERSVKDTIKKTKIFMYKGNDLAVQACETLINSIYTNDVRGVGGKNVLVLGSGNIGFKISQKIVESGGNVFMYRRDKKILDKIVFSINALSPKATMAKAIKLNNFDKNLRQFDLIIGATNGKSIIKSNHVEKFKSNVIVIDVGKGIFEKRALDLAIQKNINLFRLDVTPAYNGYLENISSTEVFNNLNLVKSKISKNYNLIKKGILGKSGSIIVDNVNSPKKVLGIADGKGSFKKNKEREILDISKLIIKT